MGTFSACNCWPSLGQWMVSVVTGHILWEPFQLGAVGLVWGSGECIVMSLSYSHLCFVDLGSENTGMFAYPSRPHWLCAVPAV
jgi:hypothetical protein